jgi:hypothetical protein
MKRKKIPKSIQNDLEKYLILMFRYPLDNETSKQSELVVKTILRTYKKEIKEGTIDYVKRKNGMWYFFLFHVT